MVYATEFLAEMEPERLKAQQAEKERARLRETDRAARGTARKAPFTLRAQ